MKRSSQAALALSFVALGTATWLMLPRDRNAKPQQSVRTPAGRPGDSAASGRLRAPKGDARPHPGDGAPGPPATVDPSTPHTQKDFTLLDTEILDPRRNFEYRTRTPALHASYGFSDAEAGSIGLWILMPRSLSSSGRNVIAATARSSSGDIFRLETLAQKITVWKEHGLLFTYIPAGYPNTFKYVDVMVKDPQRRTVRWRITDLPRMRHALVPPIKVSDTFRTKDVTVQARAWRHTSLSRAAARPGRSHILCELRGTAKLAKPYQWELVYPQTVSEWEPMWKARRHTQDRAFDAQGKARMMVRVPVAYPQYNRYLRLQGQLRKSHAFEEKVTFRDVSFKTDKGVPYLVTDRSQSLQTPSGITITLPEQNGNKPPRVRSYRGSSGFFYVHLDIDPDEAVLPGSPLYRKYKKPVRVTVEPAQGSSGARWSRSSRNYTVSFRMPQPPDSLTLRIQQQVDLQNIPLTLTVPVAGGAPPGGRVAAR